MIFKIKFYHNLFDIKFIFFPFYRITIYVLPNFFIILFPADNVVVGPILPNVFAILFVAKSFNLVDFLFGSSICITIKSFHYN